MAGPNYDAVVQVFANVQVRDGKVTGITYADVDHDFLVMVTDPDNDERQLDPNNLPATPDEIDPELDGWLEHFMELKFPEPCQNCGRLIAVDHIADDFPVYLHVDSGLGECDADEPFGPGACPAS